MDFLHTRMCFGKFWEQQEKFYDTKIFLKNFVKKFTFCGGGVNVNLEKVYILIFLHPSLMSVLMMLYVQTAANIFVIQKRKDKVGKPGVVRRVRQTHPGSNSVHCSVLQTFSWSLGAWSGTSEPAAAKLVMGIINR